MRIRKLRKIIFFFTVLLIILPMISSSPRAVQAKPFLAATPSISLEVPPQVMIGEGFSFTVFFSNTGDAPGYGPFVDVVFPTNGVDGLGGTDTPDGLVYDAVLGGTYSDSSLSLECVDLIFDTNGEVVHPFYRDTTGAYQIIEGTTGDTFVSCLLPFGSFVPQQPDAPIVFHGSVSDLADAGIPLSIRARSGFMFGSDPLDNWCCDALPTSIIFPLDSLNSGTWTGPNEAFFNPHNPDFSQNLFWSGK